MRFPLSKLRSVVATDTVERRGSWAEILEQGQRLIQNLLVATDSGLQLGEMRRWVVPALELVKTLNETTSG